MSNVSEIREAEATPRNIPPLLNDQKPDEDETSKQDFTSIVHNTPQQNANLKNEPPKQDSPNANPQNSIPKQDSATKDPNSKRDFGCLPLPGLFAPKETKQKFKNPGSVPENTYSKEDLAKSIETEIRYIQEEAKKLENYKSQVDSGVQEALQRLNLLKEDEDQEIRSLRDLQKAVTKMKLHIPKQKADIEGKDPQKDQRGALKHREIIPEKVMKQMPQLYKNDLFVNCPEFKQLEVLFNQLPVKLKLCLLCFSIFPGNEDIKKRLMEYWWMTEGLVPLSPPDEETMDEESADEFFDKLTKMGFIEPVNKNRNLSLGSYRMHPFIRTALVTLAEKAKFFDFDNDGEPTERFSESFQSCLVGRGLIDYQDLREGKVKVQDLEKLHAVINVNEPILELKKEWLQQMKNVNVLYLGRWKASATHHIEVEDEEEKDYLDGLQDMNHLKFFSLQGVSRIMELPDSISKLSNLMILDLRACHNLESLPEKIGFLKNLTHLDISECYLLERMPKGIASLSELRILKGFVVGERSKYSCNLEDLVKLKKLIKLTIYTGLVEFPGPDDVESLQKFEKLRKLTITWGGSALKAHLKESTSEAIKQGDGGERKKEVAKAKQGGRALQTQSSKVSKTTKPVGIERKENAKEIQGEDASRPQSSKTTEARKPDGAEREKEKTREKQGENASEAQLSRSSGTSRTDGAGERQKETPKDIQEGGNFQTQSSKSATEAPRTNGKEKQKLTTKEIQGDLLQAPSTKNTSEAVSKPESVRERKENNKEIQGGGALKPQPSITAGTSKPDGAETEKERNREREGENPSQAGDGVEGQKETHKEIEEGDGLQALSSKGTSEAASKPETVGERKNQPSKEKQGKVILQAPPSKSADDGGQKEEKIPRRQKIFGKISTFRMSTPRRQLELLEKLDIKCFPKATTPDWLKPSTLKSLKKLYIRGGKFSDLGQCQDIENWRIEEGTKHTWKVETLRLKYLRELEMDWRELLELFPKLVYLEKVNCPKLSFFPCNGYGLWINPDKTKAESR